MMEAEEGLMEIEEVRLLILSMNTHAVIIFQGVFIKPTTLMSM